MDKDIDACWLNIHGMLDNRLRIKDDLSRLQLRVKCGEMKGCGFLVGPAGTAQDGRQGFLQILPPLPSVWPLAPHSKSRKDYWELSFILITPLHSLKAAKIIRFLKWILPEKFYARVSRLCVHIFFPHSHFCTDLQMGVYDSQQFCTLFFPHLYGFMVGFYVSVFSFKWLHSIIL